MSLTGRVSGTLQAAESAAARVEASGRVHVVNTQNASLGQGLLTILAAECAQAGMDLETTLARLRRAIPQTVTFGIVSDLTYAVRGGRVPKSRKMLADFLRITPVLKTLPDGQVSSGGVLFGRKNPLKPFAKYIAARAPEGKLRFLVAHADCEDNARQLEALLQGELPDATSSGVTPLGTAIGVHAGPGALVVGLQRVDLD